MTEHEAAPPASPPPETNGLGLAGFIVSLIGLCSGGILSPIGLVLSFVALFRQPRGFAIAGFVLGLIGSLGMLFLFVVVGSLAVVAVLAGLIGFGGYAEMIRDGIEIREAAEQYHQQNDAMPGSLGDLSGLEAERLEDFWGNQYRLQVNEQTGEITIISDGPDGQPGTDDDIDMQFDVVR